ncbi:MAG: hypothetical protein H5T86_01450 [Armatimonadetes bacterium]|nr:hypothetical protein [Armatimonadota bacterium]
MLSVAVLHSGGAYPERVIEYLSGQPGADVRSYVLPVDLPLIVDDAGEFLPSEVAAAQVVIAINIHLNLLAELPYTMGEGDGEGKALLVPREDPLWVRPGLMSQVTRACARFGIETAFPKPFCELEPLTPAIAAFCEQYRAGRPRIAIDCAGGEIIASRCLRSSPCGLTAWVVEQIGGAPCDASLLQRLADLLHHRPCFASMAPDPELGDTIMHKSMRIIQSAGREALEAVGVRVE